ncbi:MAG TPA: HD-GYP domain-containing protein [Anaeromyxobacter sp.]|nr:HD-GYP domain-containing protein [Anaeromyxobacter sp.]
MAKERAGRAGAREWGAGRPALEAMIATTEAFALAVEAKDPYTHGHSRRVSLLAEQVSRELGLARVACETVRIAGVLHDIGKIGIPEGLLRKPGKLNRGEMRIFERHSQLGWRIVSAVPELEEVGLTILHHHERFDGQGYPERLSGERIPILSRILAVCDAYDAMTSDRPYRDGVSHRLATDEIGRNLGKQFDPSVARAFLRLFADKVPSHPDVTTSLWSLASMGSRATPSARSTRLRILRRLGSPAKPAAARGDAVDDPWASP